MKEKDWYKQISENWTQILKDFHVFWNGMRASKQIDQVKEVTKKVLSKLLEKYSVKENYYFQVTKVLVKKIREGYKNFIVAHQALDMMEKQGLSVIGEQILKTYDEFSEIKEADENNMIEKMNISIAKILDLNLTLMLIYHKLEKKPELTLNQFFEQEVITKIHDKFQLLEVENTEQQQQFKKFKEYTVVVLLKLKHQFFIFNNYHKDQIQYFSESAIKPSKQLTVKIYHELMDNLTDLISHCIDESNLKHCVYFEIKKVYSFIANKYQLKSSYTGIHLYHYLQKFF